jgi:hypothetical protein
LVAAVIAFGRKAGHVGETKSEHIDSGRKYLLQRSGEILDVPHTLPLIATIISHENKM